MPKESTALRFLQDAESDPVLSARVLRALERGGRVTAEEIMEIAKEFGYSFSRTQFESDVRNSFKDRLAPGEQIITELARKKGKPKPKPPDSSCAKGCVSWTTNYHPVITVD